MYGPLDVVTLTGEKVRTGCHAPGVSYVALWGLTLLPAQPASALTPCGAVLRALPPSPLPPLPGGRLCHDTAPVRQVDPLWHRGHQQLGPPYLPSALRTCAGHWCLPCAHGGQVSSRYLGSDGAGLCQPSPLYSCHASLGPRGDHTYAECCLTVVARGTEAVVFSIDGSFTASVSIMGSDPKVRAGAVDVVR